MPSNQSTGKSGELLAEAFLKNIGYTSIGRNYHTRFGEIDLIMREGDTIVFVEVKARTSEAFGAPSEAVTVGKLKKLLKSIDIYLAKQRLENISYRIDVVSILLGDSEKGHTIEHIKNVTM